MDDLAYFPADTRTHVGCLFSGLRVRWYERGPMDAPVVLCLHGFPELAVSWREQLEALSDHYRVVAPDMRGYGGTDAPRKVRDYDLDVLVRDIVELIDALGADKVHLVGHDWGAAVAWEVAQFHGDRLHSLAILNCPPVLRMLEELRRPEQLRRSLYMLFFQLPFVPERLLRADPEATVHKVFLDNAYNRAPFTRERLEPYVRQLRERGVSGLNYYRAAVRRLPRKLRPIRVPTRLIWGLRDKALGPWFTEPALYQDWVEDFDRVLIEDAGHWVMQEAPQQVNEALRSHFSRARGEA